MVEGCSSDDQARIFEDSRVAIERDTVNRVARAAFATNKNERSELIALRKKMMELRKYLVKNGLSVAEFEKQTLLESASFNAGLNNPTIFITGRDEYGLPIFNTTQTESGPPIEPNVFDELPCREEAGVSGVPIMLDEEVPVKNTCAKVVPDLVPPVNYVVFNYCPRPAGSTIVSSPIEVLKKGNEKFKNCIVGTFSKRIKPFSMVASSAMKA
ncbi:hypothetical protein POM88_021917 [Heracleum sosnowskyi]|uniref:Uncharacterized protein n=1 Tax=Heracleum sosnowskyi TaxID=360622 RepID=A0AAD8MT93_9APIA|nr:hypothetical protein POM88_021917 [Heracleum sosnowskyi]